MIYIIVVFIFGLILGSFLNVCIHRLPKNKSVVFPASHCPKCGKGIVWHDNIPLVSYILLKGRCRSCGARISFRYFLVEFLTASILVILFAAFGANLAQFFAYAVLASCLVVATFVDFEIREIPDQISVGGLIAGILLSFAFPSILGESSRLASIGRSILGALAGGAAIYAMGFLGEMVFRKEAMGGGDVKLMAMIGSFLGWKLVILAFFLAPVFGVIPGLIMKFRKGSEIIPYGPYLSLAALVALFAGEKILKMLFYGIF